MTDRQYGVRAQAVFVFAAALALRLMFCFVIVPIVGIQTGPGSKEFYSSTDGYMTIATNLVEHGVFGFDPDAGPTTYRGPVFPFVLAAFHLVIRDVGVATVLVNCLASAATCVVVFLFACSLLGRSRAMWLTIPAMIFPLSIYYCASSFSDTVFTLMMVLYVYLLHRMVSRPDVFRGVAHGVSFAFATLTKGILLPFPVVLLVYGVLRRRAWTPAAFVSTVVGFSLIAPWTWRNYEVSGEWVVVSVGPGFSMLAGNYMIDAGPHSDAAIGHGEARALKRVNGKYATRYTRASLKTAGHWNIAKPIDNQFAQEAWAMFREQPKLLPRKLAINAWRFWYFASNVPKCLANLVVNYPTLILAVVGMVPLIRRRDDTVELLILLVLFTMFIYAMVNVSSSRYSLPAVILLTPFASLAVGNWLAGRQRRAALSPTNQAASPVVSSVAP